LPWRYAISKWCFVAGTIKFIKWFGSGFI